SPCGSDTCAVAAHGLPVKYCRLPLTLRPRVRGTSTVPISLNMCGRSFGRRPFALVRLLGSRPDVVVGKAGATVLTWGSDALAPLDACRPDARENVYEPIACQWSDRRFSNTITRPLYVSE